MNNRHRTRLSATLSASALALMIGIGAAHAQTSNEPRKVGETSWPAANPDAQKAADEKKTQATDKAANNPTPAQNDAQSKQQSFASIRLGTDAGGKVAVNDDQQRQLAGALRKQRVQPVNLNAAVQVGSAPPQDVRLSAVSADIVDVLPQFRGYSYFATANEVYIVDPEANRVIGYIPVKMTATASRSAPATTRGARGSASAETTTRSTRTTRRGGDLAGVDAAVEREMARRGMVARGTTGSTRTVVIEEPPAYRAQGWYSFFGGRYYDDED